MLEGLVRRMERHLRRSGLLRTFEDEAEAGGEGDPEGNLGVAAKVKAAVEAKPNESSSQRHPR